MPSALLPGMPGILFPVAGFEVLPGMACCPGIGDFPGTGGLPGMAALLPLLLELEAPWEIGRNLGSAGWITPSTTEIPGNNTSAEIPTLA